MLDSSNEIVVSINMSYLNNEVIGIAIVVVVIDLEVLACRPIWV